jgi:hypothetical protein
MSKLITLKINRLEKYTVLDLTATEDKRLSWAAKGLHTYLISRPDGWQVNYADLLSRSTDGKHALQSSLKELKEAGYLAINNHQGQGGRFVSEWQINQSPPPGFPVSDFPYTDFPVSDFPQSENQPYNNKQTVINNKQKTDNKKQTAAEPQKIEPAPVEKVCVAAVEYSDLIEDLTGLDFSVSQARQLIEQYGPDKIADQLRWLPDRKPKNPGATLRAAITQDWGPPNGSKPIEVNDWKQKQEQKAADKLTAERLPLLIERLKNLSPGQHITGDHASGRKNMKIYRIDFDSQTVFAQNRFNETDVLITFAEITQWSNVNTHGSPDPSFAPKGGSAHVA